SVPRPHMRPPGPTHSPASLPMHPPPSPRALLLLASVAGLCLAISLVLICVYLIRFCCCDPEDEDEPKPRRVCCVTWSCVAAIVVCWWGPRAGAGGGDGWGWGGSEPPILSENGRGLGNVG
uniref:Protein tweety homolog n=1 Tax=Chrysemys picta bellii TaxID=8478 RepID=A0A8C3HUT8_CHRPI